MTDPMEKEAGGDACEGSAFILRAAERLKLRHVLTQGPDPRSTVLVVRGATGLGKTALLDHAAATAGGRRVVRLRGTPAEADMPYSALHLLCTPLLNGIGLLPPSQREALEAAFGLRAGPPADRFLVGIAALGLLSAAAEEQPLLCVVDDAQWLDQPSAQVLAFVTRRLGDTPVVLLLAERGSADASRFTGLPELVLGAVPTSQARSLLDSVLVTRVDEPVVERIILEARGNPRALLESVGGVAPAELAGGYGVPAADSMPRHGDNLRRRIERLGADSRLLLVMAAAEPLGDPALLWRAAALLALTHDASEQLTTAGLLSIGARVLFEDPHARHLIYGLASLAERHTVHRALAMATDPVSAPDRRAWHLAQAATAPDDALADTLTRCAQRAAERGGLAGQAAFLDRAALLTADARLRSERALTAAALAHEAGAADSAQRLLGIAGLGPLEAQQQARLAALRARVEGSAGRADAMVEQLLAAASELETGEPELARETYLEALTAAITAGRLGCRHHVAVIAEAVHRHNQGAPFRGIGTGRTLEPQDLDPRTGVQRAAGSATSVLRVVDPLLEGLLTRITQGYAAAVAPLKLALKSLAYGAGPERYPLAHVCLVAPDLWDDESWDTVTGVQVRSAREAGAVTSLPYALTHRALVELHRGDFTTAAALVKESAAIRGTAGRPPLHHAAALLTAWQGQENRARDVIEGISREASDCGDGLALTAAEHARSVLYNGLSRYREALASARRAGEYDEPGLLGWSLVELVEAAVRCDEPMVAAEAVERLSERTSLSGTNWALGVAARSRALLHEGDDAEEWYTEAVERLRHCRFATELARTQLVYGEWLRRQGRRVDARVQLCSAHQAFVDMGATAFAGRASRELLATGQRARRRDTRTSDELTPQEAQIAVLVCDGLSNPQIGTRLSISPRTVEYHLHKVFAKLGISSRVEIPLVRPDIAIGGR